MERKLEETNNRKDEKGNPLKTTAEKGEKGIKDI